MRYETDPVNQLPVTPEERAKEREENMNPPDEKPFKQLACAVIFSAAKNWHGTDPDRNRSVTAFFRSEDYDFWANIAGIDVDGETIINALARNGGILKYDDMQFESVS